MPEPIPLANPNVVSLRDSLNQLILSEDPERERPIAPEDERVPLTEPTAENLFDFLSLVRTALINIGAAKEPD